MNSEEVFSQGSALHFLLYSDIVGLKVRSMNESPLIVKSKAFALDVIKVCKELRTVKCESALINQFLRSGR